MEIQCECGKFRAELTQFPKNTPGRLKCYCDDCQSFMHYLKRSDLLDANGGTEIVPIYPSDMKILAGKEQLKCTRIIANGMYRFSTICCNTPVGNTDFKRAWIGTHRRMFGNKLDQVFTEVRASILGKFGHGTLPPGVPEKFNFKGFKVVMPFMLKGQFLKRNRPSPFFENEAPVVEPYVLSSEERAELLKQAGF